MTADAIHQIVRRLPPESPYYRLAFRDQPERLRNPGLAERLAVADSDPAFLWFLASSYAAEGLLLPSFICNSAAQRANCFLLVPDHPDYHVARVQALNLPQLKPSRDVVRGLICARDMTLEQIAERCHLAPDVVRLFSELTWNFRDRAHEPMYVSQLLYTHTRFPGAAEKQLEEADPGLRLVRLGYQRGAQAVLHAAGLAPMATKQETPDAYGQIQRALLSEAAAKLAMGLSSAKDNPALAKALQLLLLERNQQGVALDDDDVRGLGGMSIGRSLMETFLEITRPDVERQLALQNEAASPPQIESNKPVS